MKRTSSALRSYIWLTGLFFLLIITLPANHLTMQQYKLSAVQYHTLLLLVELPLVAVWFAAFYGYAKLEQYATAIRDTPEGPAFQQLANGCKWLAWGLPIPSLLTLLLGAIANNHASFHATTIIIGNYAGLIFPLIAFGFISESGRELIQRAKLNFTATTAKNIQFIFVVLGVIYCYLIFRHLDLHSIAATNNQYFLPVWLLVLTLIIPYLYAWFIGLLAAYDILLIARTAKGIFYQQALRLLASGLAVVIATLIAVQYIRSVLPRSGHLSVSATFILVYAIYAATAAGFILMAAGANRLKKIEEI